MSQFKTKQEAEEHIKQIAEDVVKKFEKDMMQMSDEELDSLRKRLNYTVSEAQCKRMNEEFHREQTERRKNLPKEEQVLYDTYIELLDQSLISGFCHYAYVYLDKDGKYQLGGSTLNSILGVPFIRFCSDEGRTHLTTEEERNRLGKYYVRQGWISM